MAKENPQIERKLFYGRLKAAELLDLSASKIDIAIRSGELDARRVGRRVLISHDELLRFVEGQGREPRAPERRQCRRDHRSASEVTQ